MMIWNMSAKHSFFWARFPLRSSFSTSVFFSATSTPVLNASVQHILLCFDIGIRGIAAILGFRNIRIVPVIVHLALIATSICFGCFHPCFCSSSSSITSTSLPKLCLSDLLHQQVASEPPKLVPMGEEFNIMLPSLSISLISLCLANFLTT